MERLVITKGIEPELKDVKGRMPMMIAMGREDKDIQRLLLGHIEGREGSGKELFEKFKAEGYSLPLGEPYLHAFFLLPMGEECCWLLWSGSTNPRIYDAIGLRAPTEEMSNLSIEACSNPPTEPRAPASGDPNTAIEPDKGSPIDDSAPSPTGSDARVELHENP